MNQTTTDHLVTERTSTITPLETPSIFECAQKTRWASNFADDVFTLHERQQGVIILHILAVLYALSNSNLNLLLKINFFFNWNFFKLFKSMLRKITYYQQPIFFVSESSS